MRPVLPEKKVNLKLIVLYIMIAVICITGIGMALYMQYFQEEKIDVILGVSSIDDKEDEYTELKNNFSLIFKNDVDVIQEGFLSIEKINNNNDIVSTRSSYKEQQGNCNIDVAIPIININNEEIIKYNEQLKNMYEKKIEEGKVSENGFLYNVKYKAYVQDNIISLVIYSELKEKENDQKVMIDTYNYDLLQNKKLTLEEVLNRKNISTNEANNRIIDEIKQIQTKNQNFSNLGYNMYNRDISSEMYKVQNTNQFFIGENGNIYVIYAYGNNDYTSEMDLIIFG